LLKFGVLRPAAQLLAGRQEALGDAHHAVAGEAMDRSRDAEARQREAVGADDRHRHADRALVDLLPTLGVAALADLGQMVAETPPRSARVRRRRPKPSV